jgi:hypothetical protein
MSLWLTGVCGRLGDSRRRARINRPVVSVSARAVLAVTRSQLTVTIRRNISVAIGIPATTANRLRDDDGNPHCQVIVNNS